jgi:hypothetical protein
MTAKPVISPEQALGVVPLQNQAAKVSRRALTNELMVTIPMRKPRVMVPPISWILPFRKERRIALDKLGEEVFKACDGHRSASDIIEDFARRHDLKFHEARIPVMQFLRDLMRRGAIVLAGGPQANPDKGSHR